MLVEPEAEQEVVAGDRVRDGDLPLPADREGRRRRRRHDAAVAGQRAHALARRDPLLLADERHPLPLDRVEAHPERRGLRLGDLADVGGLLVGRHRPAADDVLRLADHQPREVVAVHRAPRRDEEVVAQLEPRLEAAQRRVGLEALALVDQLAGPGDELVAGHVAAASSATPRDERLAVGARPQRPGAGPAVADRRALEARDRQDPGDAARDERLVGLGEVARS